jgi:23S rRNA (guanosine2251-2'-O)-methyltransferase
MEGEAVWNQTFDVPMAFVVGNEGRGMRKKTGEHCDFMLTIPMLNNVESLNASVSAALVCYEWRRQRDQQ